MDFVPGILKYYSLDVFALVERTTHGKTFSGSISTCKPERKRIDQHTLSHRSVSVTRAFSIVFVLRRSRQIHLVNSR